MTATTADAILETVRSAGRAGVARSELADRAGVHRSAVTRAVKRLAEDGRVLVGPDDVVRPVLRRGRRLLATLERDELVYGVIARAGAEGVPLADIAEQLNTTKDGAYQSVWRLRRADRVRREGITRQTRWVARNGREAG